MGIGIILLLLALGVIGGILSGMIGIGGGLVFVPLFDALFKMNDVSDSELVKFTLANSFFSIFIAGIVTSVKQYRQGSFYMKEVILTALPAMLTGLLFTYMISVSSWYSESIFKSLFLLLLIYTVVRTFLPSKESKETPVSNSNIKLVLTGLLTGIASSLSGLGGGIVMIPLFRNLMRMDMKKAASVSIGVIPFLLLPMLIVYLSVSPINTDLEFQNLGYLAPFYVLPLALGIWAGTSLGLKWANKLSNKALQIIFAVLLIILIIKYILEFIYK